MATLADVNTIRAIRPSWPELRGAALAALLAACGSAPAVQLDHLAIYGTSGGIQDLSIARSARGVVLATWTEGALDLQQTRWLRLSDDDASVHAGSMEGLGRQQVRTWSPLLATGDSFDRLTFDGQTLGDLHIDEQGVLIESRALPFTYVLGKDGDKYLEVPAVALGGEVVVLGQQPSESTPLPVLYRFTPGDSDEVDIEIEVEIDSTSCGEPLRARMAKVEDRTAAMIFVVCDGQQPPSLYPALGLIELGPGGLEASYVPGAAGWERSLAFYPAEIALVEQWVGSLWRAADGRGRMCVHTLTEPPDLDGCVTFDDAVIDSPRLLVTDSRFLLIWRTYDEGGVDTAGTRALVIEPASGKRTGPFEWPLDDDRCPIADALPTSDGLEYVCVGRCSGRGCTQSWLYRGHVEIR